MIKIPRNTLGDTRTAERIPTINEFNDSNMQHRIDVSHLMRYVAGRIECRAPEHDWTKTADPYRSMFYQDMIRTMTSDFEFTSGEWAKQHYEMRERHHLNRCVPDAVDLIDVIEMICDCVAAGLARSGEVRAIEIDSDVLQEAVRNTARLLEDECVIEGGDQDEDQ